MDSDSGGTTHFQVCWKLKHLQSGLSRLNKLRFPNVFKKEEEARSALLATQKALAADTSNTELLTLEREQRENLSHCCKASTSFMTQRVKRIG